MSMLVEILKFILGYGVTGFLLFLVVYWLIFPDKASIASGQIYKLLRLVWKGAEKKYIENDTQGRVNDFVNNFLSKEIKDFVPVNMKLSFIENDTVTEESFLQKGKLIVRMRKSENQNVNLVNASMVFIAQNVLSNTKRYISSKQRESVDLFVAKKLFETEKQEIMRQFVDDYLIEKTDDRKIGEFFEKYHFIDKAGLFFPVFMQEMRFLGDKVFANRQSNDIHTEVNGLIDFLNQHSNRVVGDRTGNTSFNGLYCKFGIMIVGIKDRIEAEGQAPYISHLETLQLSGVETIYLLGDIGNKDFMKNLCADICGNDLHYSIYHEKEYVGEINLRDGSKDNKKNYLTILRNNNIDHYFPSKKDSEQ